ncbi:MAG: c-type cytochrome [Gammaproteobacteria bacterium]|nr:c-type cytochrome [Gammaproteobacteria bacterium]MBL6999420.1 c-type cytochrome [Gammaproteobacteria bacterium]
MKHSNKIILLASVFLLLIFFYHFPIDGEHQHQNLKHRFQLENYLSDGSSPILPIPLSLDLDPQIVALGERLFADPLLSSSGFSCLSCHPVTRAGVDGLQLSMISGGGFDSKNTPTVFNSAFNALQLWNGRLQTLEQQIDGVIHNPQHMNNSWPNIIKALLQDQDYSRAFDSLYPNGLTSSNIMDAIATYERSLITPNADFDRFLWGERDAITAEQKQGYKLFTEYGCISCHQGINVGGNLFARFGIFENHLPRNKPLTEYDYGRYSYTGDNRDKFVFRVPSLRNVAVTAPYFHDGSASTLSDAIRTMAHIQLDLLLSDEDIASIESFLTSLTGEFRGVKL